MLRLESSYSLRWAGKHSALHLCRYDRASQTLGTLRTNSVASVEVSPTEIIFKIGGTQVMSLSGGVVTVSRIVNRAPPASLSRIEFVREWERKSVLCAVASDGALYATNFQDGASAPDGTDQMLLAGVSISPSGFIATGAPTMVSNVITDKAGTPITDKHGNPIIFRL